MVKETGSKIFIVTVFETSIWDKLLDGKIKLLNDILLMHRLDCASGGAAFLLLTVRVDRHRGGSWVASRDSHELKQMPREVPVFHWINGRIIFPSVLTWIISFTLVRLFKKPKKQSKENLTYSVPTEGPNEWLKIIIPSTEQWLLIRCSLLTAWHTKWRVSY